MKSADEASQNDYLRLPSSLFFLALESNQLHGVEVDGQQRVVDRGGQITLIPPLRAKQFVQTDQQANVEDIETDISTDCHRAHQHPLRGPAVAPSQWSILYDIYMARMYASNQGVWKTPSTSSLFGRQRRRNDPSSLLFPTTEDLFQRSFVSGRYLLCSEAKNFCISLARARAAGRTSSGGSIMQVSTYCRREFVRANWVWARAKSD